MANLTFAEALRLGEQIRVNPLAYENQISDRLTQNCPQISWPFRRQKAKELVQQLIAALQISQSRDGSDVPAPTTIDFLNANMLLFQDFIHYDKKYPFAVFQVFRFRDSGGPGGGEQFGIYWIVVADEVELVFPDGKNETVHSGFIVMDNLLVRPTDEVSLRAIYHSDGTRIDLKLKPADVIHAFTAPDLRDVILNWLKSHGVVYQAGQRLLIQGVMSGEQISNYAGLELTVNQAHALAREIANKPDAYIGKVFKRLSEQCPQIARPERQSKAQNLILSLGRQLVMTETRGSTVHIAAAAVESITRLIYLFQDFLPHSVKHPWIEESTLFRFDVATDGTALMGFCWMTNADEVEVLFPTNERHNAKSGLKILPHTTFSDDVQQVIIRARLREVGIWEERRFHRPDIIEWRNSVSLRNLVVNWLLYNGIDTRKGARPRSGQFLDGEPVRNRPFKYVNATDYPRHPEKYGFCMLISGSEVFYGDLGKEFDKICQDNYKRKYNDLFDGLQLPKLGLYAPIDQEDQNYVPVVGYEIEKAQQWVEASGRTGAAISFRTAKEFLLRMRIEFSLIPVALNRTDPVEKYGTGGKTRRRVQIGDQTVSIGSPKFWSLLRELDARRAGDGLAELQKMFFSQQVAAQVYSAWMAEDWEVFWNEFLRIGWDPARVCRNFRTIVHFSDLHIGHNYEPDNFQGMKTLINGILSRYKDDPVKPLVVVTGDIADCGKKASEERGEAAPFFNQSRDELFRLVDAGYTVIPIPGNHDYCSARDFSESFDWLTWLGVLSGSPEVALSAKVSDEVIQAFVNWAIDSGGYKSDRVTGIDSNQTAVDRYAQFARNFLPDWHVGSALNYIESYFKPKSGLNLILLDSNDTNPGFFMSDGEFRFARGVVNNQQIEQIRRMKSDHSEKMTALAVHHWLNYYPAHVSATAQILEALILNEAERVNYDGNRINCCNGSSGINCFHYMLCKSIAEIKLVDWKTLETFMNGYENHGGGMNFYFNAPTFQEFYRVTPGKYARNPAIDLDNIYPGFTYQETHRLTNETDLFSTVDAAFLLLVGHRHKQIEQRPAMIAADQLDRLRNELRNELSACMEKRRKLIQSCQGNENAAKERIKLFLREIRMFKDVLKYPGNLSMSAETIIDRISEKVLNLNFSQYESTLGQFLNGYSESEDSAKNQSWREIKIDLRTGEATFTDRKPDTLGVWRNQ